MALFNRFIDQAVMNRLKPQVNRNINPAPARDVAQAQRREDEWARWRERYMQHPVEDYPKDVMVVVYGSSLQRLGEQVTAYLRHGAKTVGQPLHDYGTNLYKQAITVKCEGAPQEQLLKRAINLEAAEEMRIAWRRDDYRFMPPYERGGNW